MKAATIAVALVVVGVGYLALVKDQPSTDVVGLSPTPPGLFTVVTKVVPESAAPISAPPMQDLESRATHTVAANTASTPAVPAAAAIESTPTATYAVQVAAVPDEHEAATLAERLAKDGYGSYLESVVTGQGRLLRVRIGPLPSHAAAQDVAARLGAEGYAMPWIAVEADPPPPARAGRSRAGASFTRTGSAP